MRHTPGPNPSPDGKAGLASNTQAGKSMHRHECAFVMHSDKQSAGVVLSYMHAI